MIKIPHSIQHLLGNRTYRIDDIGKSGSQVLVFDDMVLKMEKKSEWADNERVMMEWLSGRLPVPRLLCAETQEGVNYLLMTKIEGEMACDEVYMNQPEVLTVALAESLKTLWAVDIKDCPCRNDLEHKLRLAAYRVEHGLVDVDDAEPDTYGGNDFESPRHLLDWLIVNKPEEDLVLSHGDFCLPNVFLKDGRVNGFIDLGTCGIADKWQDIALCYRSLLHNFRGDFGGRLYENFNPNILFEKLGIEPDFEKLRYFILLDELF